MNREHLSNFVKEVSSFNLLPEDLKKAGAYDFFMYSVDRMDKAYGKDAKVYYSQGQAILNLLKQVRRLVNESSV